MTAAAETAAFPRKPLPKRFCNLDRVLHALEARGLDGIVATHAEQRLLPVRLQRHRAQVRRAARVRRDPLAACARASRSWWSPTTTSRPS